MRIPLLPSLCAIFLFVGSYTFAQDEQVPETIHEMDLSGMPSSIESLLSSYYKISLGGEENWDVVQSVRFNGFLDLPGGSVEFVAFKKKPNFCKVVLQAANGMRIIMATDGEDAWQLMSTDVADVTTMPAAEAVNFVRDSTIGGHLLSPTRPGKTIKMLGTKSVEGDLCYHFEVTLPDQQVVEYFIGASDFLERRQIVTNAVNQTKEVTTHSEHQDVHGLKIPFKSVMTVDGERVHAVRIVNVEVNTGIVSWMFSRDAAAYVPGLGQRAGGATVDESIKVTIPEATSVLESQFKLPEFDNTNRRDISEIPEIEL